MLDRGVEIYWRHMTNIPRALVVTEKAAGSVGFTGRRTASPVSPAPRSRWVPIGH